MSVPDRAPDRELTLTRAEVQAAVSPWDAKMMAATLLEEAGFRFEVWHPFLGDYRLQAPWSRTEDPRTRAVTYRQWDEK